MCVSPPGSVGKSTPSLMVAASISCSHGHTSDATVGAEQRSATAATTTTTTTTTGHRHDRPLYRQSYTISRSIADQHQLPAYTVGALEQPQLKQLRHKPLLASSVKIPNLICIPVAPITNPLCSLYIRSRHFVPWSYTRTVLSTLVWDKVSRFRKQRKKKS